MLEEERKKAFKKLLREKGYRCEMCHGRKNVAVFLIRKNSISESDRFVLDSDCIRLASSLCKDNTMDGESFRGIVLAMRVTNDLDKGEDDGDTD